VKELQHLQLNSSNNENNVDTSLEDWEQVTVEDIKLAEKKSGL
jgi:hypothetical protein